MSLSDPRVQNVTMARITLVYQLRSSTLVGAADLTAMLDGCSTIAQFRSAACAVCGLAFQQAGVAPVREFIGEPACAMRGRTSLLSVVPTIGCLPPDEFTLEACLLVKAEVSAALATCALTGASRSLELPFDEDTTGGF